MDTLLDAGIITGTVCELFDELHAFPCGEILFAGAVQMKRDGFIMAIFPQIADTPFHLRKMLFPDASAVQF